MILYFRINVYDGYWRLMRFSFTFEQTNITSSSGKLNYTFVGLN
jgi:hypothetical protein